MVVENIDDRAYNKSFFMTTHNSYRWSITEQLESGIRGFELDIHDNWTIFERIKGLFGGKGKFKIGHWFPGHEVAHRKGGNPRGNNLEKWLGKIAEWSKMNQGHPPITVFLDIKDSLIDYDNHPLERFGLVRLNEQIYNAFKDDKERLFTYGDYLASNNENTSSEASWPTIGQLRDKIIVVLMSFHIFSSIIPELEPLLGWIGIPPMHTRVTYQKWIEEKEDFDPICFVAFNPDDRNKQGYDEILERQAVFVTVYDLALFPGLWDQGKITRTDYNPHPNWPPFPTNVNFPSTDKWTDPGYQEATELWVK